MVPDGSRIAFGSTEPDGPGDHLNVINADGTGRRQLVALNSNIGHDWSPDGTKLAFAGLRGDGWDIYVMDPDADDGDPRQLTFDGVSSSPRWSPDGHTLAFDRYDFDTHSVVGVFLIDADGSNQRMLRGGDHGAYPAWSPDGSKIAFCREQGDVFHQSGIQDLWVLNTDGSDLHRVAQNVSCGFAWSPSGQQVAYTSTEDRDQRDIYVVTADGTTREKLVRSRRDEWRPVWSPEGRRIAFTSQPVVGHDERGRALYGTADIFTIDIDTKQQRRLTHAADGEDNYVSSWH